MVKWSNYSSKQQCSSGTYTATVTDTTDVQRHVIIQYRANTIGSNVCGTNVNASEATTAVQATATGGTAPYTYLWSNGKTTAANNNIAAGTYTATVTDAKGMYSDMCIHSNRANPIGSNVCRHKCELLRRQQRQCNSNSNRRYSTIHILMVKW
ncbi:MAG: hypothetical protein IPP29_23890 [Bacteroidetes bacterium]|nr:hypothetical protein [Bacteroidota bacterium]